MQLKLSILDMDIFKDVIKILKNTMEITQDYKTKEYIDHQIDELVKKYVDRGIEQIIP